MLINIIFFVTMIPATFLTMLWLAGEMMQAFEDFSEEVSILILMDLPFLSGNSSKVANPRKVSILILMDLPFLLLYQLLIPCTFQQFQSLF